jgi:Mg2+-importing ATPase
MKSPLDEAILAAHPFDMTGFKKIDEVPFDFERRRVSVLVEHGAETRLDRQGRAGGSAAAVGRIRGRRRQVKPLDPETRRLSGDP